MDGQLNKIDVLLKSGNTNQALIILNSLLRHEVPTQYWFSIADYYRRVQNPWKLLFWLQKKVRPSLPDNSNSTDQDKALYALGLSRIGAFSEAKSLFSIIDHKKTPIASFYESLMYISQWKYKNAIPLLKHCLKQEQFTEYQFNVFYINLFSSLVLCSKYSEALSLFELIENKVKPYKILLGNLYEIYTQLLFNTNNTLSAEKYILKAEECFIEKSSIYYLMIKKWKSILKLSQNYQQGIQDLKEVKAEAINRNQWEIVRDCDFYDSYFSRNDHLFLKVYWGTRFKSYREILINRYKWVGALPSYFEYGGQTINNSDFTANSSDSENNSIQLDLNTGIVSNLQLVITNPKISGSTLKVIRYLSSDFYSPFHMGEIQELLYSNEYFNIETTPFKLKEMIRQVRQRILKSNLPIKIKVKNRQIYIEISHTMTFKCYLSYLNFSLVNELNLIQCEFKYNQFTCDQFAKLLNKSDRTARRILQSLILNKKIKKMYAGSRTKYQLIEKILKT